jgi:hypothetical protein
MVRAASSLARGVPLSSSDTSGKIARDLAMNTLFASLLCARLPSVRMASSFSRSVWIGSMTEEVRCTLQKS